jgi:membrane protease YdiL (CAAX protease family)
VAHDSTPIGPRQRPVQGPRAPVGRAWVVLAEVAAAPAARLFAVVWLAAALVLVASGQGFPWFALVLLSIYLPMSLATAVVASGPAPADPTPGGGSRGTAGRRRLGAQIGLLLIFVVLTGWTGLVFHGVVGSDASIPLWTPLTDVLHVTGARWFARDNYLANPVTYVALPLAALLLAGARLPELGFARGHRVGPVLALWCTLPVVYLLLALVTGPLSVGRLAGRLLSNTMQNGFWEEFLFRGALQTRLRQLLGPGWAIVLQALVFGAWHLGLGFTNTGHAGLAPALASVLVHQSVIGLALGVIFERTRNLLAPSVVHVLVNSLG